MIITQTVMEAIEAGYLGSAMTSDIFIGLQVEEMS